MTLAALITSDVADVFLETDDFATAITHYPAGDETAGESVTAIVDYDSLDMPSGGDGSGVDVSNERGVRIRQAALLEIALTVTVTEQRGTLSGSTWLIGTQKWVTKRVIGKDESMQTVEIVRVDQKTTKRVQPTP